MIILLRSFGCVVAELVLRKPLFPGRGEFDMLQKADAENQPPKFK